MRPRLRIPGPLVLLVVLVILVGLLVAGPRVATRLGLLPTWRAPVEAEVPGDASHAGGRGIATLFVPDASEGNEENQTIAGFAAGPWTYGWVNFLQQEMGPYSLGTPSGVPAGGPGPRIVPRALAEAPWPGLLGSAGGGTTVVECPGAGWADILGSTDPLEGPGMERVISDRLGAPIRAVLLPCPVREPRGDILARDGSGRPLIWSVTHDGAHWIGLGFDLAHSVLAAQQGVPSEDLQVENRFDHRHGELLQTSDLVYSEELLDTPDPAADRLERLLGLILDEGFPRPRLWYYPDSTPGVFVMTHDDEAFGDPSRWMTEHEATLGVRSTMLFQPGKRLSVEGAAGMVQDGAEIGVHWNRLERAGSDYRRHIWLGVEWSRRRTSLAEQTSWLRGLLPPDTPIESVRTHFLTWGPDYGSIFRAAAAQGFVVDSSYGVDFGERGYLFGTGRPFQALDRTGLPLPVWEIPHVMAEDLAGDREWLDRLLAASAATEHQVINVLFHPSDMDWRPSVELYELWKSSYSLARIHGHAILPLGELTRFWRRRIESRVEIEKAPGTLRVRVDAAGPGHAVVLPTVWEGWTLDVPRRSVRIQEGLRESWLVPVPAGSSAFDVPLEQP